MIKKLYSVDPEEDENGDGSDPNKKDKDIGDAQVFSEKSKADQLNDAITNRTVYTYKYSRLYYMLNFNKAWCCCCRAKPKRNDFLFREAKKKLYSEIDLLEIVKKMRVNMFASDVLLKPR